MINWFERLGHLNRQTISFESGDRVALEVLPSEILARFPDEPGITYVIGWRDLEETLIKLRLKTWEWPFFQDSFRQAQLNHFLVLEALAGDENALATIDERQLPNDFWDRVARLVGKEIGVKSGIRARVVAVAPWEQSAVRIAVNFGSGPRLIALRRDDVEAAYQVGTGDFGFLSGYLVSGDTGTTAYRRGHSLAILIAALDREERSAVAECSDS